MTFVFDLDDTISETDKYSERYILKFFKTHNLPYKLISKKARFAEQKFNWNMDTALNWYKQYGDEMMLHFPAKKNAVKVINTLHDNGHKIIIATARATDWHIEPEKITKCWLSKVGLKYDKLYVGRIDKEKICEEENADIFVDDDIKITTRVAEHFANFDNKQAYLFTSKFNKNLLTPQGVKRIKSFKELLKLI